jgi:transposase
MRLSEAAALLGMSYRQAKRVKARYAADGDGGLVHGLRGRASNNQTGDASRSAVLKLYRAKYAGFGPTLACEYLARDGHEVSHDALGRWLRAEGLFEKRRKRGKHRLRRARRKCAGELVQMDGSWHDWLEGRGPWCCLMVMVDDATGRALARFYDKETLSASFDLFGRYAKTRGLPRAIYVDKAGIYRAEEGCPPTQFGRAMAELGVELILANSPQAKGRVERVHGTHQDRLCKLLRLEKIDTMADANAYLERKYWAAYNRRFSKPPAEEADLHRKLPAGMELDQVLCLKEQRTVGQDWCVSYQRRVLQIGAKHQSLGLAGRKLELRQHLDGRLTLHFHGRELEHEELKVRTAPEKSRPVFKNREVYRPSAQHPYNRAAAAVASSAGVLAPSAAPPGPAPRRKNVTVLTS